MNTLNNPTGEHYLIGIISNILKNSTKIVLKQMKKYDFIDIIGLNMNFEILETWRLEKLGDSET